MVYFLPATLGRLIISPDDGVIFNVPLRIAAANLLKAGYLPLWNPYVFSGMPLHAAAQAGLLLPLNWFYLFFRAPLATNLMMLTTFALAALGAYLYARRSGTNIAGAVATSLIWQCSAFLVSHVGHTNILQTAALLPWVLWSIDGYGMTGERKRGVLLAVLVALQVFAGHQQTFAYSFLLAGAYALVMARANSGRVRTSYLWSTWFLAAGAALAALQILPTLELLRNSLRATASYDFFSSFSMPPRFVLTFVAPYLFGGGDGGLFRVPYLGPAFFAEYVGYVGVPTIMLAVIPVLLKRDARTLFWTIVVFVCLLLAFGRFLPFDLYRVVYHIPVLNLFRVPARHLMEVEFALAVLAGRGLSILASTRGASNVLHRILPVAAGVLLFTILTVTWLRPEEFRLGRAAPVSILRAPELFVPILMAALATGALWFFAREARRRAVVGLFAVLVLDLLLFGQSSGWRVASPTPDSPLWQEPAIISFLRKREAGTGHYRVLTQDVRFEPHLPVPHVEAAGSLKLSLQPNFYMMFGVENAAGYDGFGLGRYSRLAADMKVWGDLTHAERALRSESREIDILNVRYLLARPLMDDSDSTSPSGSFAEFAAKTESYGGLPFATESLDMPSLASGERLVFNLPPVKAGRVGLITSLSWSVTVPDETVVGHLRLRSEDGREFDFDLRAGIHTSEWAYDRQDIRSLIRHERAPVATSYVVEDATGNYDGHTYVASFDLPETAVITGGEFTVVRVESAPEIQIALTRLSLLDPEENKVFPLRKEWIRKALTTVNASETADQDTRWQPLGQVGEVTVFENRRVLPRAWLVTSEFLTSEDEVLEIIRGGKLLNGRAWEPLETALVASPTGLKFDQNTTRGSADIVQYEPNRIHLKTTSTGPAILVLSENHYPGWRAYVDGDSVETLRVNYNLRGVLLSAGNHEVELLYRPKSLFLGLIISAVILLALILWWSRILPERRK